MDSTKMPVRSLWVCVDCGSRLEAMEGHGNIFKYPQAKCLNNLDERERQVATEVHYI
jgi:hypothetical protein